MGIVSRDRLVELVAEIVEGSETLVQTEEGQYDLASEIVDQVLNELQAEESEEEPE